MATDTVQTNTRISRSLKDNGDAALERAGYSPSQAVRKLWEFAARNAHNPRAIQNLLEGESTDEAARSEAEEERARRREVVLRGTSIMAEAYERCGIKPSDWTKNASYEEMRDCASLERLGERGLVAAAERANATYLITNDETLIKHSPVAALTPADALALLQAEMA